MTIPKSYEALAADLASEKILSKTFLGQKENFMKLYDAQRFELRECNAREAALREELDIATRHLDRMIEAHDDAQQRLTVAEQRAADLKKLLCDVINEAATGFAALKVDLANRVNDALNPADHPQCEECKGWGYHENHYEGGGTECGECGGSGNAAVAEVMVMPDRMKVEPFTTIDRGSKNYKAGYNAAISDAIKLNGLKP